MDEPLLALTRRARGRPRGPTAEDVAAENMRQLTQLRWLAVGGQLLTIAFVHYGLGAALPLAPMLAVVGMLAAANLLFAESARRGLATPGGLFAALLFDVLALVAQLYLSGGTANPFISLLLVQIVLGAILLGQRAVWALVAVASLSLLFLSRRHLPLPRPAQWDPAWPELRLVGEGISFALVATLLVLFITRITRNLRARDAHVAELAQRAAEEDGIVRMGLFASGAAHELGTPLSSLSVLVSDWRRHPMLAHDPALREELAEADAEVRRCRDIVTNILHSAGQARSEAMASATVRALFAELTEDWRVLHERTPLRVDPDGAEEVRIAGEPALRQAVWSLLENAAEAAPRGVVLEARVTDDQLVIAVLDRGPGFTEDQLARVGRLYQSTKGEGHGLGMFLAGNVARRLGGSLRASNRQGGGAEVRLSLPLATLDRVEA